LHSKTNYSKTSLIQTPLNQASLNPDRVSGKRNFYFGADNSTINHWRETEVTEEESEDEHEGNTVPKIKTREVKEHLNRVINFVQESDNEDILPVMTTMRHLRDPTVKEVCKKPSQKKIGSFSNQFLPLHLSLFLH
jgi:hypothetical protein